MDVSRALAKHDAHAVPLDQSPICCVPPTDMEAKHVVEILGASIDVGNSEYEGPRRDLRLHACLPSFVSIGPQYRIWRHPHIRRAMSQLGQNRPSADLCRTTALTLESGRGRITW